MRGLLLAAGPVGGRFPSPLFSHCVAKPTLSDYHGADVIVCPPEFS